MNKCKIIWAKSTSKQTPILLLMVLSTAIVLIGCSGPALISRRIVSADRTEKGVAYSLPMVRVQVTADLQTQIVTSTVPALNASAWATNSWRSETIRSNSIIITNITSSFVSGSNSFIAPTITAVTNYKVGYNVLTVTDPNHLYSLRLKPRSYAADHFTIIVNTNGFLSSVNSTNEDRTGQIIKSLAETAANVYKAIATLEINSNPLPEHLEAIFDPSDKLSIQKANEDLTISGYTPIVRIDCNPLVTNLTNLYKSKLGPNRKDGVLYRPTLPYLLTIESNPGRERANKTSSILAIPNASPVFSIPIDRAAFVAASTSVTFQNGFLTSLDYNKPSQIEGFVSIPLDLSKMVVSLPTNLVQMKIDLTSKDADLAKQQQALTANQSALLNAYISLLQTQHIFNEYMRTNK